MYIIPQLKVIIKKKKGNYVIQNKIKGRMRKEFQINLRSLAWKGGELKLSRSSLTEEKKINCQIC